MNEIEFYCIFFLMLTPGIIFYLSFWIENSVHAYTCLSFHTDFKSARLATNLKKIGKKYIKIHILYVT